ncbi:MAG TPA: helix-turn-helix domain-containing protein [Sphingomicrobium sp.]|nr:helix-turn-helix domain-containing protein [Sphingomicrobium sp.]
MGGAEADRETVPSAKLSPRQEECLRGVLALKSAKEIARELGVSPHAVEKHLRLCREKFGVASSVEAARLFAREQQGSEYPYSDFSDLAGSSRPADEGPVLEQPLLPSLAELEDTHGALLADYPLTPRQTLLTIAAVSFASIVGLLLLVACAEGIRTLVTG